MTRRRLAGACAVALGASALVATSAGAAGTPKVASLKADQNGNRVTVTVKTRNFEIDTAAVGKAPMAGHGHEHFQMDGGKYDFPKYSGANGKLAVQLGVQGKYSPSVTNMVTYKGLPKGKHKVTVFLAQNNHASYANKGAKKTITFTVR